MKKAEVISKMKALNFPQNSYVVFGSGPMAALGIREVRDIDLYVSPALFQELKKMGWKQLSKGPLDEPLTHDLYEAHEHWKFSPYSPTLRELLSRAFVIEGITFASIEDVRRWKEESGGDKHMADVRLIDEYIKKQNL